MSANIRMLPLYLLAVLAACQTQRHGGSSSRGRGPTVAVQALVGVADYHALRFERSDPVDSTNTGSVDLATMPVLGAAGQYSLTGGGPVDLGLDASFLVSWDADRTSFVSSSGTAVIVLDRRLLLLDVALGALCECGCWGSG